jgi:formamidopyrimidine-DNA glycosylase
MPELPEVEVTRRSVASIAGAKVLALRLGKPLRWPWQAPAQPLPGCSVGAVWRRGKYLWLPLSRPGAASAQPEDAGGLLLHLGMSGSLAWGAQLGEAGPHAHFELLTDRGVLRLTDPRRFGAVLWSESLGHDPAARLLARLGPEPFDEQLNAERFHAALRGRRVAIKPVLLAGQAVVGVGNIYASDALFEARIHPATPCERIGLARAGVLLAAVRQVLGEAIEAGGSTLRDFRDAHGVAGAYQQTQVRVYGRAGLACSRCGHLIERQVQGQRATYFCPGCQSC